MKKELALWSYKELKGWVEKSDWYENGLRGR
jgi:hypothetical protein